MTKRSAREVIRQGVSTSRTLMSQQDEIWSRYSPDKVDIGETLARVLRTLARALPLDLPLRALSVGSSTEPRFRILEASVRGGLYLLDIERAALAVINERIRRQSVTHVATLRDNYTDIFADKVRTRRFLRDEPGDQLDRRPANGIRRKPSATSCTSQPRAVISARRRSASV